MLMLHRQHGWLDGKSDTGIAFLICESGFRTAVAGEASAEKKLACDHGLGV